MVDINKIMEQIDLSKLFKGAVADGSFTTPVQSNLKEFTPKNMLSGAVAGNPWGSDGSQNMTSKPNLDLINSSYNPQKNQSTPYSPEMYKPQAPVTQAQVAPKPVTFQPSEVPVVNNVMEQIDINKLTKSSPYGDTPIAPEQPLSFWDKTTNFLGSPTGRSLGAGLLTSGLVGLSGGSGLEALSYGSQAGGTASNVYREQMNKDKKRQQEDNYFKMKIEQDKSDREARQLEMDRKIAHDFDMAEYNRRANLDKMYKQNEMDGSAYKTTDFKDAERLSANFGNRMIESSKTLDDYENKGGNAWGSNNDGLLSYGGKVIGSALPDFMGGSALQRIASSDDKNIYDSMAENWITANLRKESGAVINTDEFAREKTKYFPQVGDSKAAILEKQRMRKEAEKGMIFQSNGAYNNFVDSSNNDNGQQMPQVGGIVDGYRYIGGNLNDANSWEKI